MKHLATAFILALLLVLTPVSALDIAVVRHDTDIQSTYQNLKVCSCGGQVDVIRVKNVGDLQANYVFQLEGDVAWFTLDKSYYQLQPEQSVDVYVFTSAPCGSVGTYKYSVYVQSEYGRYRAVNKEITTGVCESIAAVLEPSSQTLEPCNEAPVTLTLTNVATFTEDYRIESDLGFPEYITLAPGETTRINGAYQATCSEWGTSEHLVTITSIRNNLQALKTTSVTVTRAYDYSVSIGDIRMPVCAGVTSQVPVTVTNNEDRTNSIALTTEPDNNKTTVTVRGDRDTTVSLPFTPARAGNREFIVDAIGLNGSIEKNARITVPVEACYGLTVDTPSSISACPGEVYIPFPITSDGSRTQDLAFEVRSNTTTYISSLTETLRAGEIVTKTVTAVLPDADRLWYVTLSAMGQYAQDETTIQIKAHSTESCYAIAPTQHEFSVWTDQETLPVIIKQTGIEPGTYTVSYTSSFMQVVEDEVTLAPGGTSVLHFTINATGYPTGRYVDRLMLSTKGVDYTNDFEIKLREKGAWQHFLDACRADDAFAVCSVTSVVTLALLIATIIAAAAVISGLWAYRNPATRSREAWGIVGGILLIALLIAMLMTAPTIPRTYERPIGPSSPSDLAWEIGEGQSITINLTSYFSDPDSDRLAFVTSPTKNLGVTIRGTEATIVADTGFAGDEQLVFSANDGRGGYADSEIFTISVVPYRPINALEFWQRACWFLAALFAFLAIAIAMLIVMLAPKEKIMKTKGIGLATYGDSDEIGLDVDSDGHALTTLEQDVLQQAKHLVHAEQAIVAQNMVINQNVREEGPFVASVDGKRFHSIHSPYVKRIPKDKRVVFQTKEEAIKGGYTPAKMDSTKP